MKATKGLTDTVGLLSSRPFYKPANLALGPYRISAQRSSGSQTIYFTCVPSSLVECSFKNLSHCTLLLFQRYFSTLGPAWIISRLPLFLSNVVSPHLFSLSSQLIIMLWSPEQSASE